MSTLSKEQKKVVEEELHFLYHNNQPRLEAIAGVCKLNVPHSNDFIVYRSKVLDEAEKQYKVTELIEKVLNEYPNRSKLRNLLERLKQEEAGHPNSGQSASLETKPIQDSSVWIEPLGRPEELPTSTTHIPVNYEKPPARPTLVLPCSIILSYASEDSSDVDRLKKDLLMCGITDWRDHTTLRSDGSDKKEDLQVAIAGASAVVLVVTDHTGHSSSVREEISMAQEYQRPIYLFWMGGDLVAEVIPTSHRDLLDARTERYQQALQDLTQVLGQLPLSQDLPPRNPYKGPRAFKREDAEDFFGRERLIDSLFGQVKERLTISMNDRGGATGRLLTVLGPSGSGKSSLIMAGLVPRFEQEVLLGNWIYWDTIVLDAYPLKALVGALRLLFPQLGDELILDFLQKSQGLHKLLERHVKQSHKRVILVIDQFEKLLIQVISEKNREEQQKEQQQFLELVLTAITEPHGPLFVILTLRADCYDRLLDCFQGYPRLVHLVEKHSFVVGPMEVEELRAVIEQPALRPDVQATLEGNLVDRLLFDFGRQVGALPLLQCALFRLFQQCQEQKLTLSAYENMGGVRGILAQQAEEVYRLLSSQNQQLDQNLFHILFSRLIGPDTLEVEATKRRVPLSTFTLADSEMTQTLAKVIEVFTDNRILTLNNVEKVSTIEMSHDCIIGAWERLQHWIDQSTDTFQLQQTINSDTTAWIQHGRSTDRLYRGDQLLKALTWRDKNIHSVDEAAFLAKSMEEQKIKQMMEQEQQQKIQTLEQKQQKKIQSLEKEYQDKLQSMTRQNRDKVQSMEKEHQDNVQKMLTEQKKRRSILMVMAGIAGTGVGGTAFLFTLLRTGSVYPSPFQPKSLPYAYTGHTASVSSVVWSPDCKRIASAGVDKTVQIWDASSGTRLLTYTRHTVSVNSVAWSPDGKRIASASADKIMQVWDVTNGNPFFSYTGHTDAVNSVAWSPDGKRIASASADKIVQIRDATNGNLLFSYNGHTTPLYSVAWSPDGKHITSAGLDKTVQVWDVTNGNLLSSYSKHTGTVYSVAWSPDGKRIASASADKTVQVWDATSGNPLFSYSKHNDAVNSVAWSADGRHIASAGQDKTVQVWSSSDGTPLFSYNKHTDAVNSVAWSPDGIRIASASNDQTVQVWWAL